MTISRAGIEETLKGINDAENSRPNVSVDEIITRVDALMADDVEGWHNGVHKPNREAERQVERMLFGAMADYHRDFDKVVVDPPYAAFNWTMKGTFGGKSLEMLGCSILEINDDGKIQRYWLYADSAQMPALVS